MSDSNPLDHPDSSDLSSALDGLGNALASHENTATPPPILARVRTHRRHRILIRSTVAAVACAAITLVAFIAARPTPRSSIPAPELVHGTNSDAQSPRPVLASTRPAMPTIAALRRLNQNASADNVRLPEPAASSTPASPTLTARDARDPAAIARMLSDPR